jgi:hypothetical protein
MRRTARRAAILAGGAALVACGTAGVAAATTGSTPNATPAGKTLRFNAFDVNVGSKDPGFIPVPGTNPKALAQGDELVIDDQLTVTHLSHGGFTIVGFDSGVCTLTRIPNKMADGTLANCVVTAVLSKQGSITAQGAVHFKGQQAEPGVLAVTGGTGRFDGATGTLGIASAKHFKVFTFRLK